MFRVSPVSIRARSGVVRLALSCCAAAVLAVAAVFPASAATILNSSGRLGGVSLVDTSANPGVTCQFALPLVSLNQQPALTNIVLSGPTVGPIVSSAGDSAIVPALVSVDFRVYQPLTVNGEPARFAAGAVGGPSGPGDVSRRHEGAGPHLRCAQSCETVAIRRRWQSPTNRRIRPSPMALGPSATTSTRAR